MPLQLSSWYVSLMHCPNLIYHSTFSIYVIHQVQAMIKYDLTMTMSAWCGQHDLVH